MRRFALLAALPLLALGAPPAHAAGGTVEVSTFAITKPLGSGYLVIAICRATAIPNVMTDDPDVPLSTSVACSVNGESASQTAPGGNAVAIVTTATTTPMIACHRGNATFLDVSPIQNYPASKAETCAPIGPA